MKNNCWLFDTVNTHVDKPHHWLNVDFDKFCDSLGHSYWVTGQQGHKYTLSNLWVRAELDSAHRMEN